MARIKSLGLPDGSAYSSTKSEQQEVDDWKKTLSMIPGYKQVEAFVADEEYEKEEEVEYVTLDLGKDVSKELLQDATEYRLVGLDTMTPFLQVSNMIFRGTHEVLVGTELLFTDGRDETDLGRKFIVPVGTTEKRIKFEQVEVKEKTGASGSGDKGKAAENQKSTTEKESAKEKNKLSYGESLISF